MLVVPGHFQGSVSSGKVFVCRAVQVLGEHRVVPVVAVGGLIPELPVTAGSGCAALGHLGEGALVAVEVLQAGLGWVSVCVLDLMDSLEKLLKMHMLLCKAQVQDFQVRCSCFCN